MAFQYDAAFVQQYNDTLIHTAQQGGSVLGPFVRKKIVKGKSAHFDLLGPVQATKRVSRHQPTEITDPKHSRRKVTMEDWTLAMLIDEEDELRALINPTSEYAMSAAMGMGVKQDEVIMSALLGASVSVDPSDNGSNIVLPASQTIDKSFGTSSDTNLTVEKLRQMRHLLRKDNFGIREMPICVTNSSGLDSLLGDDKVANSDYNAIKALVNGEIDTFMGFKFVQYEGVQGAGTTGDPVLSVAFMPSTLGFALGRDITTRISERNDLNHATQVHSAMTIGAVRVEETKVVTAECVQA